jgi:hypothetical protein
VQKASAFPMPYETSAANDRGQANASNHSLHHAGVTTTGSNARPVT